MKLLLHFVHFVLSAIITIVPLIPMVYVKPIHVGTDPDVFSELTDNYFMVLALLFIFSWARLADEIAGKILNHD